MEGFCLDIQRIILKDVCNYNPFMYSIGQLFPLLSMNHMFRTWIIRYVLDTIDKKWFAQVFSEYFGWNNYDLNIITRWDIYGHLLQKWSPSLVVSFLMYLELSRFNEMSRYISNTKAWYLFFANESIFADLECHRKSCISISRHVHDIGNHQRNIIDYEERIDNLKRVLEISVQEKEVEERVVESLNKKWKRE